MSSGYSAIDQKQRIRFYADYGPTSLFERVRFKMKNVHRLYMHGDHFVKRISQRNIPEEVMGKLLSFDINEWILKTAEVRADRGKFISSTWEVLCDNKKYWVTIGLGNCVITIVQKNSNGMDLCVRDGEFYDFVENVNRDLMDKEKIKK